jgi:hypothetical protein
MATFQETPNGRVHVIVRRYGRRTSRVFDTRAEAAEWAQLIEDEARQNYYGTTRIIQRYGVFMAVWQYATRILGGNPEDEAVAAYIADNTALKQIARLIALSPPTGETVLGIKADLERQMELLAESAAAERRAAEED